jgi:hypothetical protein
MQKPDEGMAKIAAATGGGYFELTSPVEVLGKFDRVIEELHHQYALGFLEAVIGPLDTADRLALAVQPLIDTVGHELTISSPTVELLGFVG